MRKINDQMSPKGEGGFVKVVDFHKSSRGLRLIMQNWIHNWIQNWLMLKQRFLFGVPLKISLF